MTYKTKVTKSTWTFLQELSEVSLYKTFFQKLNEVDLHKTATTHVVALLL